MKTIILIFLYIYNVHYLYKNKINSLLYGIVDQSITMKLYKTI
jgi:hypothetical protein